MKQMSEYKEKITLRYSKNLILASGQKWHYRLQPVSVYQLISIFLMTKNTVLHDNCSSI